jgi:hypothetical protein
LDQTKIFAFFSFSFKADRWLSDEKDDQKTFIDLLPGENKTPSSSPVLEKGISKCH